MTGFFMQKIQHSHKIDTKKIEYNKKISITFISKKNPYFCKKTRFFFIKHQIKNNILTCFFHLNKRKKTFISFFYL